MSPSSLTNSLPWRILDSGATGSFVTTEDQRVLTNLVTTNDGPTILAANGNTMPTQAQGQLQLSSTLTPKAQHAFVLDDLKTGTLISLSQLCDDDCIVLFTKYGVNIIKNDQGIITDRREHNGLWSVSLQQTP